ncbi:MAG: ATP-binding protein [Fidelibacterota bacterium]
MRYDRIIYKNIQDQLNLNKVILVVGPRRVGKTVLLNQLCQSYTGNYLLLDGEDLDTAMILERRTVSNYQQLLDNISLLLIDEAQKIDQIGAIVKLMIDHFPHLSIILTGSSAFDLKQKFGEPLTGRKITHHLFPLSQKEFSKYENILDTRNNLEKKLIFGCYPEVWQYRNNKDRILYLRELVNDYLFKDILELENIHNAGKLKNLLRLLAFQIGKEVSNDELSRQLRLSRNTVEKYLELLAKVFVIFKLEGFSRNLRKEITKNHRWYFIDNGILNTILSNFKPLSIRQDVGLLWENYIISERRKYQHYCQMIVNNYFWRTYDQQEIDWVEEIDTEINGYEMKWSPQKSRIPAAWKKAYPQAGFEVIHQDNYLDWIL